MRARQSTNDDAQSAAAPHIATAEPVRLNLYAATVEVDLLLLTRSALLGNTLLKPSGKASFDVSDCHDERSVSNKLSTIAVTVCTVAVKILRTMHGSARQTRVKR